MIWLKLMKFNFLGVKLKKPKWLLGMLTFNKIIQIIVIFRMFGNSMDKYFAKIISFNSL